MALRLFILSVAQEADIIAARQRTRMVTQVMGFDAQDQNRITTAVSEIVRNALEYGKDGRVEYSMLPGTPQALQITVQDKGRGISNVEEILAGRHVSSTGMGVGIIGARRLMDDFHLESKPGQGTRVTLVKRLSRRAPPVTTAVLRQISDSLAEQAKIDPIAEVRRQSQETLLQYQELQKRQEELELLNQELSDTNRGVVALYAELEERADHLRRADQLKTRFLSNMSHEFRTPLNSILSLSRLLLMRSDGGLTSEQERQVQFIRTGAETLTDLVNNLLDLARVEAGKTVIVPKEFTITDLFGALRGMLRPILVADTVDLVFDSADDMPKLVTDEAKVSQILRNFISNAIKFTVKGEIRVWATYSRTNDAVTFHVRDSGIGIAEKDIATVWEEFGQVASSLQSKHKGTGLGLPLAKKFAMLLGGDTSVESVPGSGSIFSTTIPRIYLKANAIPEMPEWTPDPTRLPILVLEDNAADAFSLGRMLQHSKYQVITTRTIAEAKLVLEQITPAVVILDVVLEGEESWRLLIELKQNDMTHHIPVLVVSTSEEEHKARSFGADGYLDKPVEPKTLIKSLDEHTGGQSTIKVLLVDDDEVSRYLVRQLLPRGAFELSEAIGGEEALEIAHASRPDIILLDLDMPGMDGAEFLQRAQNDNALKDIPIVIATAMVINDADRARLTGATNFLSKFDLSTAALVDAIRSVVNTDSSGRHESA